MDCSVFGVKRGGACFRAARPTSYEAALQSVVGEMTLPSASTSRQVCPSFRDMAAMSSSESSSVRSASVRSPATSRTDLPVATASLAMLIACSYPIFPFSAAQIDGDISASLRPCSTLILSPSTHFVRNMSMALMAIVIAVSIS